MIAVPEIVIYVRHSEGCPHASDERSRKCNCRKFVRWSAGGKQHKKAAKTRSWPQAEKFKRTLEDQFSGVIAPLSADVKLLSEAIDLFLTDKRSEGVGKSALGKHVLLLSRLQTYCEDRMIHTVNGLTGEVLTGFCAAWPDLYPSSTTRNKLRERLRSFLKYCYNGLWLARIPPVTKFKIVEAPTEPLTPEQYAKLLDVVYVTVGDGDPRRRTTKNGSRWQYAASGKLQHAVYAFLQTMRWTGLAIIDTMTLRRDHVVFQPEHNEYQVTRRRTKTGKWISVSISKQVGDDLLKVEVGSADYFFWSGKGDPQSATSNWGQRYIAPCFKAAGIVGKGHLLSHRLRDTYAVWLLERGVPMEEVAAALGDSLHITEKHYAKWSKLRQERLNTLLREARGAPPKQRNHPGRKSGLTLVKKAS